MEYVFRFYQFGCIVAPVLDFIVEAVRRGISGCGAEIYLRPDSVWARAHGVLLVWFCFEFVEYVGYML